MPNYRAFFDADLQQHSSTANLSRSEAHHLTHVLRAREGSAVTLFDRYGNLAQGSLDIRGAKSASVTINQRQSLPKPAFRLELAIALLKGKSMDNLLREAAALGVTHISPLVTEHAEVRLSQADAAAKCARWQEQFIEAAKQSGNLRLPELAQPQGLEYWLESRRMSTSSPLILASLEPERPLMLDMLAERFANETLAGLCLIVGPEGDFSQREYAQLRQAAVQSVRLSSSVLRSGTAALYALSVADQWLQSHSAASPHERE